ncbi:hypothetical protein SCB71_15550 [Herbiconiux sp. KACC 21604]|uniref:hypothetical protein n=1 Tax=unclassified Herbiconiux TaxID=2618217 RepID=UPI001490998D|nr:hypothetical protein [Herbiconiux sp. SALV-R1]QJU54539.1 hypothetical protein HL652_13495 [Herbiconiux sp. SALV-R1]WPO85623.1 hypothetical protein SCB71_15550 [Herbiconiux sp. KACC 21604]
MKSVSYAGLTFETADEIADALLQLAAALGVNERSETVDIPVVEQNGDLSSVQLVIGPASQFISKPVTSPYNEPASAEVVERLTYRTRLLDLPRAAAISDSEIGRLDFDSPA